MKNVMMVVILMLTASGVFAQFSIPADAVLIESNQLRSGGGYVIEQRWRLKNGDVMRAYYEADGATETTTQQIEKRPILAIGKDVRVDAMPGVREFKFKDRRLLVQFMKMMGLLVGGCDHSDKKYCEPNASLDQFSTVGSVYLFTLSLDLYDGSWSLLKEDAYTRSSGFIGNDNYDVQRKE